MRDKRWKTGAATLAAAAAAVVAAAGAGGCKRSTTTAAPEPSPVASSSAGYVVVPASAASVEAPAPSTAPTASASSSASVAPAPEPDRFYLVAETKNGGLDDLWFVPGKDKALVVTDVAYEIQRDRAVKLPRLLDSLKPYRPPTPFAGTVEGFAGSWPDAAYAEVAGHTERGTSERRILLWDGSAWKQSLAVDQMISITATAPYGDEILVASFGVRGPGERGMTLQVTGYRMSFDPQAQPDGQGGCSTRMETASEIVVARSGEVFVRGEECSTSAPVIERFAKDGKSVGFYKLPEEIVSKSLKDPSATSVVMAAKSGTEAYMAGTAKAGSGSVLLRFDGSVWSPIPHAPLEGPITSLDVSEGGQLWAVSGGVVWRRSSGGTWSRIPLPEGASAKDVMATPGDAWVWGSTAMGDALFRSRPLKYVLAIGAPRDPEQLVPSSAACKTPFVILYKVSDTAAPDYDFPMTRKAVAGHTELQGMTLVVTEQYYFGATVPSHEAGEKLAALVKDKVKGAKPQVVCMAPKIREEIPIDLKTGDVVRTE